MWEKDDMEAQDQCLGQRCHGRKENMEFSWKGIMHFVVQNPGMIAAAWTKLYQIPNLS